MTPLSPHISVIIPCLNEEAAVGKVVEQSLEGIRRAGRTGEVIVVDNGSTDASAEVAAARGARVVSETLRGYGNAYLAGLEAAQGKYLVMGDADERLALGPAVAHPAGRHPPQFTATVVLLNSGMDDPLPRLPQSDEFVGKAPPA